MSRSDRSYPIGIDPAAYEGDIVSRLRHWRGRHLAHGGELFEAAADEIERLRAALVAIATQDGTLSVSDGRLFVDVDGLEELAFDYERTPPPQPTPGECSTQERCT